MPAASAIRAITTRTPSQSAAADRAAAVLGIQTSKGPAPPSGSSYPPLAPGMSTNTVRVGIEAGMNRARYHQVQDHRPAPVVGPADQATGH